MTPIEKQAVFEAIGEILRDQKAETADLIKAALDAGPDAVQRALFSRELDEKQASIAELCHTLLRRKGATVQRKSITNPVRERGLS